MRALGPLPSTMSSWKSSIAGYRISSTARPRRWISSTKSTSPSARLVRMAARSPARTRAGPDVIRKPAPISLATIPASEVLPSPGGPANSRWSAGWRPPPGRLQHDLEMLLELGLADELGQPPGPEGDLLGGFHRVGGGRHRPIRASLSAAAPCSGSRSARPIGLPASSRRARRIWSSRAPSAGRRARAWRISSAP